MKNRINIFSEDENKLVKYISKDKNIFEKLIIREYFLCLILIISYILTWRNYRKLFSKYVFILSIISNSFNLILLLITTKNKLFYVIKISIYVSIIYLLLKETNPLFNLLFFWLPFENLFRSFFILCAFSFFINKEYLNLDSHVKLKLKNKIFLNSFYYNFYNISPEINKFVFTNIKLYFFRKKITFIFLLFICKLILHIYDDKISYLLFDKEKYRYQTYLIAANLYNNENIINDWKSEMIKLVNYLGKENCYISVVENGDSTDSTATYLKEFEIELNNLGVKNRIITSKIYDKNKYERIVFLAHLRNEALYYLYEIMNLEYSKTKVIFFNDVIFNFQDILKLIDTNNQAYDLACGLDFYESFYDTWVSWGLDANGFRLYFPYFSDSIASDRVINGENIRVFSCWNGVVVINGSVFESRNIHFRYPTKYRQSECLLFVSDLWTQGYNRIILNPNVKFTYEYYYYYMNKYFYPWTKNLITYFYYYLRYFFDPILIEHGDLISKGIEFKPINKMWKFYENYLKIEM